MKSESRFCSFGDRKKIDNLVEDLINWDESFVLKKTGSNASSLVSETSSFSGVPSSSSLIYSSSPGSSTHSPSSASLSASLSDEKEIVKNDTSPHNLFSSSISSSSSESFFSLEDFATFEENRRQGDLAFHAGDLQEAEKCYTRCIEKNKMSSATWASRSLVYLKANKLSESLSDADVAIRIDSKNHTAWLARGRVLLKMGEVGESIKSLKNAKKLKPFDIKTHTFLNEARKNENKERKTGATERNAKEFVNINIVVVENDNDSEEEDEEEEKQEETRERQGLKKVDKEKYDAHEGPQKDKREKENKQASKLHSEEEEKIIKKRKKEDFDSEMSEGKKSYETKNYEEAVKHYTNCIAAIEEGSLVDVIDDETQSLMYSNRSQVYIFLEDYERSEEDARVSLRIKWNVKAAYRYAFSTHMILKSKDVHNADDLHSLQMADSRLSESIEYFISQKKAAPKNITDLKRSISELKKK